MESLHDPRIARWNHEPLRLAEARSGPRVCDPQPARFMERIPRNFRALDPEPGRDGALRRPRRAQRRNDAATLLRGRGHRSAMSLPKSGSWKASFRFCARIGTMNQIGTPPCPLPARRGEGGRRPGEGRFMESFHGFATAHLDHERWGETPSSPDLPATGISQGSTESRPTGFMGRVAEGRMRERLTPPPSPAR